MYNVYNPSNIFYLYDLYNNSYSFIGDRNEFILFLSRKVCTYGYWDSSRWNLEILGQQNLTGNDCYVVSECLSYLRQYTFYDGYGRIINISDYKDEVYEFHRNYIYKFKRKNWLHCPSHKRHCSYSSRNNASSLHRNLIQDTIPEYRDYIRKRDIRNPLYDDKIRRISCCWKDQYKHRKQYEHRASSRINIQGGDL
jgi:hypothetical protein